MNTLSVDDNFSVTTVMTALMQRIDPTGGHYSANTAERALLLFQQVRVHVAFLDIEMPGTNGIDLARRILEISPETNIIFITGHVEYAYDAHQVYASAFLRKPIRERDIRGALQNLRHPVYAPAIPEGKLRVQCFGNFGVFRGTEPITFSRAKTMELFAYLIYRRGVMCTNAELIGILWADEPADDNKHSYLRKLIKDLRDSLSELGFGDVIEKGWNQIAVHPEKIDCDFYRYLNGSRDKADQYPGSFMSQYPWAAAAAGYFSSTTPKF